MRLRTVLFAKHALRQRIRLARLFELPEPEFRDCVRDLEADPRFARMREAGVVKIGAYSAARLAAQRFGGQGARTSTEARCEIPDDRSEAVRLIETIGQEDFERFFLGDGDFSRDQIADACGVTAAEVAAIREFVDSLHIRAEISSSPAPVASAPSREFSLVAEIQLEGGRPVLGFFNRDIWKVRYHIDREKLVQWLAELDRAEAGHIERFLRELEAVERRKSTLLRLLELLVERQADFLSSGALERRRPMTQAAAAQKLNVCPSVISRLVSNKSVRLPWGIESPIKVLLPSAKLITRDRLFDIATEGPRRSDEGLRGEVQRLCGRALSRRSITQYRKELGLGRRRMRCCQPVSLGTPRARDGWKMAGFAISLADSSLKENRR